MAASGTNKSAAFETDIDDFEDVALLLEPETKQSHVNRKRSWKDRLLSVLARGGQSSHTGFSALEAEEDDLEESDRKKGIKALPTFPIVKPSVQAVLGRLPLASHCLLHTQLIVVAQN